MDLYVDGVLVATTPGSIDLDAGDEGTLLGAHMDRNMHVDHHFAGKLDEIEIFDRALSASEIKAICDAGVAGKCKPSSDEDEDSDE